MLSSNYCFLTCIQVSQEGGHASEYMARHWTEMSWITGFLGETGTAVITLDKALLWTDSRYYLQAEAELQGTTVELMRESDVDCPSIPEWLCKARGERREARVAVNPEMYSVNGYRALKAELEEGGLELVSIDLISPLWTENRPAIPTSLYVPPSTTRKCRILAGQRFDGASRLFALGKLP